VWTRNGVVGIGNALQGFSRGILLALAHNRTFVMRSVIIQKFCTILECSLRELSKDEFDDRHANILAVNEQSAHFATLFTPIERGAPRGAPDTVAPFYASSNCASVPQDGFLGPKLCINSRLIRSLVVGTNDRLKNEKKWLQK
jgi:hypothetical protein